MRAAAWVVRVEPPEAGECPRIRIEFPAPRETAWREFWERFDHTARARVGADAFQLDDDAAPESQGRELGAAE